jgi:hypothetical protein
MHKHEKQLRKTLVDIVCDMCNKSCRAATDAFDDFEVGYISASWGYSSKHDGETVHLDLCEGCFYSIMAHIEPQLAATRALRDQSSSD